MTSRASLWRCAALTFGLAGLLAACPACPVIPFDGQQRQGDNLQCNGTRTGTVSSDGGHSACTRVNELLLSCEEEFHQAGAIDVVWVIDNSGSMGEEIEGIRKNLETFANKIVSTGLDFHIVLITAAEGDSSGNGLAVPAALRNSGRLRHVPEWVNSTDAPEVLLNEAFNYDDWIRPGGRHHILFTTDDDSALPASTFLAQLRTSSVSALSDATIHSIVGPSFEECPDIADEGREYMDLTASTGGLLLPICCADYSLVIDALAVDIATDASSVKLANPALPDSIHVFRDDVEVTSGWSYDETRQSVVFDLAPVAGEAIIVRYAVRG